MNGPTEAGFVLVKAVGLKAIIGAVAAAAMFLSFPPVDAHGHFDRREFFLRLVVAAVFSAIFGDMAVQQFMTYLPSLRMNEHPAVAYFVIGAPGWWVSRAVALWFHKRQSKDIGELVDDVKGSGR